MTESKITSKEAICLIVTIFVSRTIVSMPKTLINNTGTSTLINLIYIGIIALLFVYVICRLMKNFASSDILDISNYLGGPIFRSIIGGIFISYFIMSSGFILRNFCASLRIVCFPLTNITYILISFLAVLSVSNSLSFSSNVKAIPIVLPVVLISILCLFFGNFKFFTIERIYPILGDGFVNTFVTGLGNLVAFGGISCIYFLPPFLDEPQKLRRIATSSVGIGLVYFIFTVATILLMFSFFTQVDEVLPLYSVARYLEFGTFFQRLESVFLLIWIVGICCHLMICNRFSMFILQKITNLESSKPFALLIPLLIFGIAIFPKNYAIIRFLDDTIYKYFIIGIVFVLGIGILVLANWKKKKQTIKAGESS